MSLIGISFAFHLLGINLWVGASLLLTLAVIPTVSLLGADEQAKFFKAFTARYLPWFVAGGATVGITGWFQTFAMLDDLNLPVAYAKHAVIVLLILVSITEWFFLARRLSIPNSNGQKIWNWFVMLSWAQSILGVIILFLTGWLTQ